MDYATGSRFSLLAGRNRSCGARIARRTPVHLAIVDWCTSSNPCTAGSIPAGPILEERSGLCCVVMVHQECGALTLPGSIPGAQHTLQQTRAVSSPLCTALIRDGDLAKYCSELLRSVLRARNRTRKSECTSLLVNHHDAAPPHVSGSCRTLTLDLDRIQALYSTPGIEPGRGWLRAILVAHQRL